MKAGRELQFLVVIGTNLANEVVRHFWELLTLQLITHQNKLSMVFLIFDLLWILESRNRKKIMFENNFSIR